jgi:hypothetical protein
MRRLLPTVLFAGVVLPLVALSGAQAADYDYPYEQGPPRVYEQPRYDQPVYERPAYDPPVIEERPVYPRPYYRHPHYGYPYYGHSYYGHDGHRFRPYGYDHRFGSYGDRPY